MQSKEEFSHFYRGHLSFVLGVAARRGASATQAEDVAQEVFLVALCAGKKFVPGAATTGWLYNVVRNVLTRLHRAESRIARKHAALAEFRDASIGLSIHASPDALVCTESLLLRLNPDQRSAFLNVKLFGMSVQEIANVCKLSINTVQSRVRLAQARLRKELSLREGAACPALLNRG